MSDNSSDTNLALEPEGIGGLQDAERIAFISAFKRLLSLAIVTKTDYEKHKDANVVTFFECLAGYRVEVCKEQGVSITASQSEVSEAASKLLIETSCKLTGNDKIADEHYGEILDRFVFAIRQNLLRKARRYKVFTDFDTSTSSSDSHANNKILFSLTAPPKFGNLPEEQAQEREMLQIWADALKPLFKSPMRNRKTSLGKPLSHGLMMASSFAHVMIIDNSNPHKINVEISGLRESIIYDTTRPTLEDFGARLTKLTGNEYALTTLADLRRREKEKLVKIAIAKGFAKP